MNPFRATLLRTRRAAVGLMVGVMAPGFLGMAAMVVDAGFWVIGQTRLQVAADAGALAASYLLTNATFQGYSAANQTSTAQAVALAEAQSAATKLVGTINTPTVTIGSGYGSVTVKLTSQMPSYFFGVFGISAPLVSATAVATLKAAGPCVIMLGTGGTDIQVDNSGNLVATNCGVGSDSTGTQSVYLNSGTLNATAIDVKSPGAFAKSNSGSNSTPTATAATAYTSTDPFGLAMPTPPTTCDASNMSYNTSGGSNISFTPTVHGNATTPVWTFCGNTSFNGNGTTTTFNAGTYYVVDGSLTFSNQTVATNGGTSFILTGTSSTTVGSFSWTNYSGTYGISPSTTGPATAPQIALWVACNTSANSSQAITFNGGSTINVSGEIYAPCASISINNNATVQAPLNATLGVVGKTLLVTQSATLRATAGSGSASATAVLTQ